MTDKPVFDLPRELTVEERRLLDFMIDLVPTSRGALRQQARTARVSGVCACGCGTYDLVIDSAAPPAAELRSPAANAVCAVEGHTVEVLLFLDGEERLGCVEIVRYGDVRPGQPLPTPGVLEEARWSDDDGTGSRHLLNPLT